MISEKDFANRTKVLRERLIELCVSCGREPSEVKLLPVTKRWPAEVVRMAVRAGFSSVGENRVSEALEKMEEVEESVEWELIGHLQSNKAKWIPGKFSRAQSVDSAKLLRRLDAAAEEDGVILRVLLQVNAGEDPAKFGVLPAEAPALLEVAMSCVNLKVEGLMTIAPFAPDEPEVARSAFERLRALRDDLETRLSASLPELSMGMSGDLEDAIRAGSTMIRVGSALFGERPPVG